MAAVSAHGLAVWKEHRRMFLASMGIVFMGLVFFLVTTSGVSPFPPPSPPSPPFMTFNVLQYNIFDRPYAVSHDGQAERLARIPQSILTLCPHSCGGVDVVTFAESDIESDRNVMLEAFTQAGYLYHTTILAETDPFTSLINGGVLIVSKWPILREAQHIYRGACHYSDCLAAKGVKYARVNKTVDGVSKAFNVFATHMQAWSTKEGMEDRIKQAQQFYDFAQALTIPHTEPMVFAGDFNVDNHSFPDEVANLVRLLHAATPTRVGSELFTSDPHLNLLVGRDGAAKSDKCLDQYVASWGPLHDKVYTPNYLTRLTCGAQVVSNASRTSLVFRDPSTAMCFCPCCPSEWLDYVLYAQPPYQQPIGVPTLESIVNQVPAAFPVQWSGPSFVPSSADAASLALVDLSDHFPVLGKFKFPLNATEPVMHLDGCSNNDDCRFHSLRCYCEGPGCYFNGSHIDGGTLPSDHPVNKNCILLKTRFVCACGPT
ncbi:hypothetical protein SDRG_04690 [Saprolegnia diclina VS20]|uniref:sphingomyelin phosphodiesterase n=1 Tax=Saprolegnia diclina (strain VS20) TaxID=1156394 RepID=T0QW41_SAPDV|nr:hypothetical protein SDRG_04690 [Saprolegnia diclina VS20]EQC38265.1 hypothetical protein SDRG_04690 [Saprolegnia diclina VS20]|eukprot:XP_008608592.1 hypothetical protein SDRG_04690 [Saprolegnia diclina VS20]